MKKKIILILLLIFLSGCEIDYDIKFDKNFRVEDKFVLTSKYDEFEENKPDYWNKFFGTRLSESKFVNPLFEDYSDYIQTSSKRYDSFEKYSEYEYLKMYVSGISLDKDGTYKVKVKFNEKFNKDVYGSEDFEELRINIDFPYNVLSSNATSNNENIYTWIINKENKINEIYIEYRNPQISKTANNVIYKLIILCFIVLMSLFAYNIYIKNKKINEL